MNIEHTLKNLIHREMRARFMWHHLEKFEREGNGYSFIVAVRSAAREYASAANLVSAIRKHFKDVRLVNTSNYATIGNNNIYAISISCHDPRIVPLPLRNSLGDTLKAA